MCYLDSFFAQFEQISRAEIRAYGLVHRYLISQHNQHKCHIDFDQCSKLGMPLRAVILIERIDKKFKNKQASLELLVILQDKAKEWNEFVDFLEVALSTLNMEGEAQIMM